MKRLIFTMVLISFLLLTACTSEAEYQDDETQNYPTEAENTEAVETEIAVVETIEETEQAETAVAGDFGEEARVYLDAIANDIGDREPGSDGESRTAEYIQGVFEEMGYQAEIQNFTADDEGDTISSQNVIATKEGQSDKVIVVGAHYDAAYEDGTNGADDNASGVAVLIEVAKLVKEVETPYTLQFVAFGSEELDLNGSTYFVENLSDEERGNIVGMFNLDSLIAGDKLYVYGNAGSGTMRDWVLADAESQGLDIAGKTAQELNNEDGGPCDCADYDAFEEAEIPFAYFEATNWDLSPDAMVQVNPEYGSDGEIRHTEYDTVKYIDETFPGRIDEHLNVFTTLLYDLVTQYE